MEISLPSITRDVARALVGQFTAFAPMPQATEGLTLTIDTLISCARSEAHARATVKAIIESPGDPLRWPSPDRIRAVAWSMLSESDRRTNCEVCNGTGWRSKPIVLKGITYDNSVRCACNGGRLPVPDGKMAAASEEVVW